MIQRYKNLCASAGLMVTLQLTCEVKDGRWESHNILVAGDCSVRNSIYLQTMYYFV